MDDIFSRLLTLTCYLTRKLIQLIENLGPRDVRRCLENSAINSCGQELRFSYCGDVVCVPEATSTSLSYCNLSNGHGVPENTESEPKDLTVCSRSEIVESNYSSEGIDIVLKGLILPIFGLRVARRLALTSWRLNLFYIRCAQAKVLRRTLIGSSEDLGWLPNDTEMAPVEDDSTRFLELLKQIGLFSNHGPLYFVSTKRALSKMGLACHIAKIHSEAAVEHNAWELKQYIVELYWGSGKSLILLGHGKDGVDAAAALSNYQDDLEDKVAGLALVQSPFGGPPAAVDILRKGQIADKETRRIMEFLICN